MLSFFLLLVDVKKLYLKELCACNIILLKLKYCVSELLNKQELQVLGIN